MMGVDLCGRVLICHNNNMVECSSFILGAYNYMFNDKQHTPACILKTILGFSAGLTKCI